MKMKIVKKNQNFVFSKFHYVFCKGKCFHLFNAATSRLIQSMWYEKTSSLNENLLPTKQKHNLLWFV